jgi:hypothetical protein
MFSMFIIQIVLNILHIQFLLINIVQMGCLIKHEIVNYTTLYFNTIQIYSSCMWSIRFVNLYI